MRKGELGAIASTIAPFAPVEIRRYLLFIIDPKEAMKPNLFHVDRSELRVFTPFEDINAVSESRHCIVALRARTPWTTSTQSLDYVPCGKV